MGKRRSSGNRSLSTLCLLEALATQLENRECGKDGGGCNGVPAGLNTTYIMTGTKKMVTVVLGAGVRT